MLTSYFPPHSLSVNWPCLRANRSAQFRRRSNTHRRKNKRSLLPRYRRTANTKETQISRWKSTENTFLVEPRFVFSPPIFASRNNKTGRAKHSSFRFKTTREFTNSRADSGLSNNDDSKRITTSISQRSWGGKVRVEPNPDGRSGKQTSLGSPLLPSLPERSRNYAPVLISSEKKGQVSTRRPHERSKYGRGNAQRGLWTRS